MKTHVLAGAFVLGVTGNVCVAAAGEAAEGTQTTVDWSGGYAGLHLGYAWGNSDYSDGQYNGAPPDFPVVNWDVGSDGLRVGAHAGYLWTRDRRVWGLEVDLGHVDLSGTRLQPGTDPYDVPYDAHGAVEGDWVVGLSAKLGYVFDRTLLYAKAGAAYTRAELRFFDTCTTDPCGTGTIDASEAVRWGYQLGIGIERALACDWTLRAEYAWVDFGTKTITGTAAGEGFEGNVYNVNADLAVHNLVIGVNYRF